MDDTLIPTIAALVGALIGATVSVFVTVYQTNANGSQAMVNELQTQRQAIYQTFIADAQELLARWIYYTSYDLSANATDTLFSMYTKLAENNAQIDLVGPINIVNQASIVYGDTSEMVSLVYLGPHRGTLPSKSPAKSWPAHFVRDMSILIFEMRQVIQQQ
ncbi:MAG: hypothetical protein ACLPQY_07915 [Streptosporangiaceae bacterium]